MGRIYRMARIKALRNEGDLFLNHGDIKKSDGREDEYGKYGGEALLITDVTEKGWMIQRKAG
jgi:hypothetical protein